MINSIIERVKDDNVKFIQLQFSDLFGFSVYGEQYNAIHINQALTSVVIGEEE